VVLDVECCSNTLNHNMIRDTCNRMSASGYVLDKIFIDVRTLCGPCCPKRCAVLIFKTRG